MPPKFRDLKRYCEKNGLVLLRDTDHYHYEKVLPNGIVLKTKVSHALHKEIPGNLWQRILKNQLLITEEEFWKKA
jgi:hypothetical protein